MFRCLGLVVLLFACCGADYEKCVEECKLDEEHKFSDHEQDVCRSADFQSKFIESSNAKCGQPVATIVKLNAPPGVTYTPVAVKVKRCHGPCKKGELICKPSAGATTTVTFHVRTEQESGKGCGTVVVEEHQACECDCSKNSNHCKENQEYDMDACECKCKNEEEMSQCEMEATKEWEHESCSCKCRNVEECDAMHEWSEKDCKCLGNDVKRSAGSIYHHHRQLL